MAGLLALMVVASSCYDATTAATPAADEPTTTVPSTVGDEVVGSVDFTSRRRTVDVFDCSNACTLVQVPLANFLSDEVGAFLGDQVPWLLTVVDGQVTAMSEVYLP